MGFTCQEATGFSAFGPCLEHVCAGGGGSVANTLIDHDSDWYYNLPLDHSQHLYIKSSFPPHVYLL